MLRIKSPGLASDDALFNYGAPSTGGDSMKVQVGFYGSAAQQIAGYATYLNEGNFFNLAFYGVNRAGGVNHAIGNRSANRTHAALRWDTAHPASGTDLAANVAGGVPASYVDAAGTHTFGAAASTVYSSHYFRNDQGGVFAGSPAGMQVGISNPFTFSVQDVGAVDFSASTHRRTTAGGEQIFSQVIGAQHAAFFYMYGRDIRAARHAVYGVQTPQYLVNILRAADLHATYTIPVGAAQGIFWNAAGTTDRLLYNSAAGNLGANFADGEVTLNIAVDGVDKGGAVARNFLAISGFEMAIVGDTFNNYRCNAAKGTGISGGECEGTFTYATSAGTGTGTDFSSTMSIAYRVIAGGAFYGGNAQEAAGAVAHLFGDLTTGGMRLQWIGANTSAGAATRRGHRCHHHCRAAQAHPPQRHAGRLHAGLFCAGDGVCADGGAGDYRRDYGECFHRRRC